MKNLVSLLIISLFCITGFTQTKQITLEDIFVKRTFSSKGVWGVNSMNDGIHYTTLQGSKIIKNSYETGEEVSVVFDLASVEDSPISRFSAYEFSDDETKILLTTNRKQIYRHSYTAEYYVWNSVTEELTPLSDKGAQMVATFSPDGNMVAFVRENNLFIKNLKFGTESQVTFDGKKNEIINGIPDWVYEEEFSFNKAFSWSPDSKFLAFIRFDETNVKEFGMTLFKGINPSFDAYALYPHNETFKYPKAGEANSIVTVHVFDPKTKTTALADIGEETDQYIPRLRWTPDANDLQIMRLNRRQNKLDVLYANPYTGDSRVVFTEKNDRYVAESFLDDFTYLEDGSFVVTSERNGWSHLYLYDRQGFFQQQITDGEFDVTRFYGYDKLKKIFYYQAAAKSPLQREVYFKSLDGKKSGMLSTMEGTNSCVFSKTYKYYINTFSNRSTPSLITLHNNMKGKQIRVLEDNSELKEKLTEFNVPIKEFFSFTTSEGIELNGWMLKPNDFNENNTYPVFMTQYSGPNSQSVSDDIRVGYNEFLAQQGYVVVCVDPRGTAARGEDFRKVTYMQLGKYETDDQIEAAKYLASLPYVDGDKIAIFGWSYGGFMVALAMTKSDVFKAGISVAPVTSYRFYDSVYTERYMRTPQENPNGYDDNSPLTNSKKVKGNLLLVHGTADDNVHAQNSYEFTEKMVQDGTQFDMAFYTNRNHGIRGGNTTMHLYTKMTNFLKQKLQ